MELKLYQDENVLREMYCKKKMLPSEIAVILNVSTHSVYRYLKKFNIEIDKDIKKTKLRTYDCNHTYFDVIDTANKSYWLGFLMADGNIENRKDRKDTRRLTVKLSSIDESHLCKLNKDLESNYPITHGIKTLKSKEYYYSQLRIGSSILCRGLMENGLMPRKSLSEVFPKDKIPKKYWKEFLLGVFDGDGCFSWFFTQKRTIPSCSFSLCGSYELLKDSFDYISEELGINVPSLLEHKSGLHTATIGGNFQVIKLMDWLYKDSIIRLDRKYEKYQEFLEEINNPKYNECKQKSNVYI